MIVGSENIWVQTISRKDWETLPESSETVRQKPAERQFKIQSELHSDMQSLAEMSRPSRNRE